MKQKKLKFQLKTGLAYKRFAIVSVLYIYYLVNLLISKPCTYMYYRSPEALIMLDHKVWLHED
jgi:hypothetical protein